jgi:hypothetical protein
VAQHATNLVKRGPRAAVERRPQPSLARTGRRLLAEVKRGDSDWTLPILLGAVIVFVATVFAVVLTIVELAAMLA